MTTRAGRVSSESKETKLPSKDQLEAKFAALKIRIKAEKDDPELHFALAESHYFGLGTQKDPKAAVVSYIKAAEGGHAEARFRLGAHSANQGDVKAAVDHYGRAAQKGHARAQFNLALCFEQGNGVEKDVEKAIEWYIKAIQNGYPISKLQEITSLKALQTHGLVGALFALGQCHEFGYGTDKDIEQAKECYRNAAQKGFKQARLYLAALLLKSASVEEQQEGFECFLELANEGDAEAQYRVAMCYLHAQGTGLSEYNAAEWLKLAARKDHIQAQLQLAVCHEKGLGTWDDPASAFNCYKKAAQAGNVQAQFELAERFRTGIIFRDEIIVAKKEQEAFAWYQKAAMQNHTAAQFYLGVYFEKGIGVPSNPKEAYKWYMKAAIAGDVSAQYNVGIFLQYGAPGVPEDVPAAITWYEKSAAQGYEPAQEKIAGFKKAPAETKSEIPAAHL